MTNTLERPGVEVRQEFRTTTATILQPLLQACIVGPANQVVEAVDDAGALNVDAQVTLPALVTTPWVTTPFSYSLLGLALSIRANNGVAVEVSFAADRTVTQLVADIVAAAIPGLLAEVETSGDSQRAVLRTSLRGGNASLAFTGDALEVLGLSTAQYTGSSGYASERVSRILASAYPDPRNNLDELEIDYDTVRVFIATGGAGGFVEASRTEAMLDHSKLGGTPASPSDDGDPDGLTPYITLPGHRGELGPAQVLGDLDVADITYGSSGDFDPALPLSIDVGGTIVTGNLTDAISDGDDLVDAINTILGVNGECRLQEDTGFLIIESTATGPDAWIVVGDEAADVIGFGDNLTCAASGSPGPAILVGNVLADVLWIALIGDTLHFAVNGGPRVDFVIPAGTDETNFVDRINAVWPGLADETVNGRLMLRDATVWGFGSRILTRLDTLANLAILGISPTAFAAPAYATFGNAHPAAPGDAFWANGVFVGTIVEVTPADLDSDTPASIRLDREVLVSAVYASWHVMAQDLESDSISLMRPAPQLAVDSQTGVIVIQPGMFVGSGGSPSAGSSALYVAYNALRLDVSSATQSATLLRYGSTTDLEADMAPIDPQNPLGFGMYLAMLGAPGVEITGLGIDETSDAAPEGTLDAYVRAFELLEAKQVYAIAPMTHAIDVGQVLAAHVDTMSVNGGERIGLINPSRPTRATDTLIASTPNGNVAALTDEAPFIDTGIQNLEALCLAAGIANPISEGDDLFFEIEGDSRKFNIGYVLGSRISPRVTVADDSFYFDAEGDIANFFDAPIVDRPLTVKIRGAALANRTEEAVAYADIARGFQNRRIIATAPDRAVISVDALDTVVPGYYLNATLAGRFSSAAPSQPMTEEALPGWKNVLGSSDYFGEPQLKILSGGGLWVFQRDTATGPVITRQQLTTDISTLKKREASIGRAVDATAMYFRTAFRNYIGRFNITQSLVDSLSTVAEGIVTFLVKNLVMRDIEIIAIRQSTSNPDEVEVDADLTPYYPCNKIRVTMVI